MESMHGEYLDQMLMQQLYYAVAELLRSVVKLMAKLSSFWKSYYH